MLHTFNDPLLALHDITLVLLSEENPDNLLEAILEQAIEQTKANYGSIAILDENRKFLEIKASTGLGGDVREKVKLKVGQGVTGRCVLTGKTRNVGDTSEDPYYIEVRSDIRSELATPLKIGSKTFGVISVDSSKLNAFNSEHKDFLELLASYAAQIFTSKYTLSHLQNRTQILEILIEITSLLGKYPDFKSLFKEIITLLSQKIGAIRAAIHMHDIVTNELYIVASLNYSEEEIAKGVFRPSEGITGTVYSQKKTILIPNVNEDENFLNKTGRKRDNTVYSFFASPIILNNETKGVFSLEVPYNTASNFEDSSFLVRLLSSILSQAIHIHDLIEQKKSEIQSENIALKRQLNINYAFENIVGKSPAMKELFEKMKMVLDASSSVLLTGESGTGKELIASAIHHNGTRKEYPLIKINCAAIPTDLLESELFGYVKGAFTGADTDKKGKFLEAHNGTIFLDEISEMDYKLQSKLLRVLQEKEFSPLGSNKVYKVDVRIIAATNANLEKYIADNKFREDLYYRLHVIRLEVPPLRDRKEDLAILIEHFIKKIAKQTGKKIKGVTQAFFEKLEHYPFPGNIRELENIIERSIVLSKKTQLDEDDIHFLSDVSKPEIKIKKEEKTKEEPSIKAETEFNLQSWIKNELSKTKPGNYYNSILSSLEKDLIHLMLKRTVYNKSKTARLLGINRLTLDRKIKDLHILDGELD
ncbi:MAG: sigma 54-interacting transcriptional regulator [Spirochaetia bacterium]|nr:sigma 54-interacting transcriptional regulator [Spirochaetia bacterium]